MSKGNIKSAGQTKNEKKDLEKLGEIISRIGLDKQKESTVCAIVAQTFHTKPALLRSKKGRAVYSRAMQGVRKSEWPHLFETARKPKGTEPKPDGDMQEIINFRAECDKIWPPDDDGPDAA